MPSDGPTPATAVDSEVPAPAGGAGAAAPAGALAGAAAPPPLPSPRPAGEGTAAKPNLPKLDLKPENLQGLKAAAEEALRNITGTVEQTRAGVPPAANPDS